MPKFSECPTKNYVLPVDNHGLNLLKEHSIIFAEDFVRSRGTHSSAIKGTLKYNRSYDYNVPYLKEAILETCDMFGCFASSAPTLSLADILVNADSSCGYEAHHYLGVRLKEDVIGKFPEYIDFYDHNLLTIEPLWDQCSKVQVESWKKIQENDLRVFTISGIGFLFSKMRYCQAFNKLLAANPLQVPSGVGLTLQMGGFHALMSNLEEFRKIGEGDISKYDACILSILLYSCLILRYFFWDKKGDVIEWFDRMYHFYYHTIHSIMVLPSGEVFQKDGGNPSGDANTTSDNTLVHVVIKSIEFKIILNISLSQCWHGKQYLFVPYADDYADGDNLDISITEVQRTNFLLSIGFVYKPGSHFVSNSPIGHTFLGARCIKYNNSYVPIYNKDKVLKSVVMFQGKGRDYFKQLQKIISARYLLAFASDNVHAFLEDYFQYCLTKVTASSYISNPPLPSRGESRSFWLLCESWQSVGNKNCAQYSNNNLQSSSKIYFNFINNQNSYQISPYFMSTNIHVTDGSSKNGKKKNRAQKPNKQVTDIVVKPVTRKVGNTRRAGPARHNEVVVIEPSRGKTSRKTSIAKIAQSVKYDKLSMVMSNMNPTHRAMLIAYLKIVVDPGTNCKLGIEPRVPTADAQPTAFCVSKRVVSVYAKFGATPGPNDGKFSILSRPVMGSSTDFEYGQIFNMGANGWPSDPLDSFTDPQWYSVQTSTNAKSRSNLAYDLNYLPLTRSTPESAFVYAVSAPNQNSDYLFGNPVLNTGTTQVNSEILVTARNNQTLVTLPNGVWLVNVTSYGAAATVAQYQNWIVTPADSLPNQTRIFSIGIHATTGPDMGSAQVQGTLGIYQCVFLVVSPENKQANFNVYIECSVDQLISRSEMYITRWEPVPNPGTLGSFDFSGLSEFPQSYSNGLASKVRWVAHTQWFSNTQMMIEKGGVVATAVLPPGLSTTQFLADANASQPGQLQEFENLSNLPYDVANFQAALGGYAINMWHDTVNCQQFQPIWNTQQVLAAQTRDYSNIATSGICERPQGIVTDTILEVGTATIIYIFELITNGQLLTTRKYVGSDEILEAAFMLLKDLPKVMENPEHLKTIMNWFKKIGVNLYNNYTKANESFTKATGVSIPKAGLAAFETLMAL